MSKVTVVAQNMEDSASNTLINALQEQHSNHTVLMKQLLSELHENHVEEMCRRQTMHEERMAAFFEKSLRMLLNHSLSIDASQNGPAINIMSGPLQNRTTKGDGDSFAHLAQQAKQDTPVVRITTSNPGIIPQVEQAQEVPEGFGSGERKTKDFIKAVKPSSSNSSGNGEQEVPGSLVATEVNLMEVRKKMKKAANLGRAWVTPVKREPTQETQINMQTRLQKIVEHSATDIFIGLVIMCNTMFVAVHAEHTAKTLSDTDGTALAGINLFFLVVFTVEVVLRIAAEQKEFLLGKNKSWNAFDAFVVTVSLIEQVVSSTSSARAVRILRVLRLIRVVRVLRLLNFLHELRAMAKGILQSLSSLIWALALLIMNMFMFAVYLTLAVAYERMEIRDGKDVNLQHSMALEENFASLPMTIYSMYKAVTGGASWGDYGDMLFKINFFTGLLFSFYVAFTTFAILNVVSGVFIGNALKIMEDDRELSIIEQTDSRGRMIKEIKNVFSSTDTNGSGKVCAEEFCNHMQDPFLQAYFRQLGLDVNEHVINFQGLFDLLDFDDSKDLDIDEFVSGCLHLKGPAKSLDLERCNSCLRQVRNEVNELLEQMKMQSAVCLNMMELLGQTNSQTKLRVDDL